MPTGMSDYELLRARNIERNNARLKALGLISTGEEEQSNAFAWRRDRIIIEKRRSNSSHAHDETSEIGKKRKRDPSSSISRKSLRLQGKQPDGSALLSDKESATNREELEKERQARVLECRQVRLRRALEVSEAGAEKAAKENPTASYGHCLMRVRTMTEKGLINRVKAIERAAGKHSVIKMVSIRSQRYCIRICW